MSVQPDLFEVAPILEDSAEPAAARRRWGDGGALVDEDSAPAVHDPYAEVVWPAVRVDRPWGDVLLARWLRRDSAYRAFRCVLCRRALVVSVAEWQADRAQLVACSYAACGGWVQRDSEPVSPEWETPSDDERGE